MKTINLKETNVYKRYSYTPTLYKKGTIIGYKRSLRHQNMSHVRIKIIEHINKSEFNSFIGKRIFYFTIDKKTKTKKLKWGKIVSCHGKSGGFLAKFKQKIPPTLMASPVFITFLPCTKYTN